VNKEETIARAKELRDVDEMEESQALLLELLQEYPEDAQILYEVGGAYDLLEEARKAVGYYQQAVDAGLTGEDLQECLLCLGICQRGLGDADEAVVTLQKAVEKFPESNVAQLFLALAYYSDGQDDEAVRSLLTVLLATTEDEEVLAYVDTLEYYKDNLDEVWEK
jgi:tetratricopeptide (TPR) repeat protein